MAPGQVRPPDEELGTETQCTVPASAADAQVDEQPVDVDDARPLARTRAERAAPEVADRHDQLTRSSHRDAEAEGVGADGHLSTPSPDPSSVLELGHVAMGPDAEPSVRCARCPRRVSLRHSNLPTTRRVVGCNTRCETASVHWAGAMSK